MFDAALHGRIDTEGLAFDLTLADIEQLNHVVLAGEAEISKVSYAVVPLLTEKFRVLNSGSALGRGNGPLLVSRRKIYPDELRDVTVAIPGEHTTANLLLTTLFPEVRSKRAYLFSDIADAVMSGEQDAGVLIHEGRFTYREIGLQLIADLGVKWERRTSLLLPLGAIVVSKRLDPVLQKRIDRVIRRSVEFALAHPDASQDFVMCHAQEMDREVMRQHIGLFVNPFSVDLGSEGRRAVLGLLGTGDETIFVERD